MSVFNVVKTLDRNANQLNEKWQYISNTIDENLLIRLFIKSVNSSQDRSRTIQVSFTSLFLGPIVTLIPLVQKSFPELGLTREDCAEMS